MPMRIRLMAAAVTTMLLVATELTACATNNNASHSGGARSPAGAQTSAPSSNGPSGVSTSTPSTGEAGKQPPDQWAAAVQAQLAKELGVHKVSDTCPTNKWACAITSIQADVVGTLNVKVRGNPDKTTAKRWATQVFSYVGKAHPELARMVMEDASGSVIGQVRRSDVRVFAEPAATSAQCQINVTGATQWVIDGSDTDYYYSAKPTCTVYDWWATATIYGPNSQYKDFWSLWLEPGYRAYVTVDDYTKPGKYIVGSKRVTAYDRNYRSLAFGMTTPTPYARFRSTASITGVRTADRRVRLTGKVRRYRGGYYDDYPLRPGTVHIQRRAKTTGAFRTVKTLKGTNGTYSWTTGRTNSKWYYRAIMVQNATTLQATSGIIRR